MTEGIYICINIHNINIYIKSDIDLRNNVYKYTHMIQVSNTSGIMVCVRYTCTYSKNRIGFISVPFIYIYIHTLYISYINL